MRLHIQDKPWDICAAIAYTVAMAAILLAVGGGDPFAVLLIVFFPGYVLVAVLFPGSVTPGKPEIDWIERIALSFGLSIAVVPLLGILLNFTPFGIRFAPIVATIAVFTVGVGYAAYWRRLRLPSARRLSLTLDLRMPKWVAYSALDKSLTIVLTTGIVVSAGTLAYIILAPRPGATFTEFYILGPGGNTSGYPTALNVSESGTVIIGVANHEATSVNYTVRIDLVGVQIVHNATSGLNGTIEINRTTWSTFNVTLADGQNWTQPYTFRTNAVGLWKVQFFLFREGNFLSAYRELHLFVRVT